MPTKYVHFTEEQKQAAKQTDLAAFLQSRGENVKRSGSEYEWVGHHITLRGNQFYDQYAQRGGTAVDFVREQYELSYPDAVQLLLGNGATAPVSEYWQRECQPGSGRQPFELPPANENMRRVYAYLIKQRCIDRDVIYHFAHRGLIYEDAQFHNAVFVGADRNGIPRHAHKKSTSLNDSSFRANQTGSEAAFSFHHIGRRVAADNSRTELSGSNDQSSPRPSEIVYVFESPIDMLSFISLYPRGWQNYSYATLCSVADHTLFRLLEDNPHIRKVVLCLDNDEAGRQATERIAAKLTERGYTDVGILLSQYKDFNEDLKAEKGMTPIPAESQETEDTQCQELQLS